LLCFNNFFLNFTFYYNQAIHLLCHLKLTIYQHSMLECQLIELGVSRSKTATISLQLAIQQVNTPSGDTALLKSLFRCLSISLDAYPLFFNNSNASSASSHEVAFVDKLVMCPSYLGTQHENSVLILPVVRLNQSQFVFQNPLSGRFLAKLQLVKVICCQTP